MTKKIDINVDRNGPDSVVHIQGDIDLRTSTDVRDVVVDLFENRSQQRVILDLKGVKYIDSSGIACLVEGLQEAKRKKARLILAGLNEAPRRVLQITRLTNLFEVAQTVDEALKL